MTTNKVKKTVSVVIQHTVAYIGEVEVTLDKEACDNFGLIDNWDAVEEEVLSNLDLDECCWTATDEETEVSQIEEVS
jgi:hypothetical protein